MPLSHPFVAHAPRGAWRLPLLVALAVAAGCNPGGPAARRRSSSFALFSRDDMRAGLRYETFVEMARRESVKQFECAFLWAKARRCTLEVEGGTLAALVDSAGRVIRLANYTTRGPANTVHTQLIYRDALQDMRREWDAVARSQRDDGDVGIPQLRWSDPAGRWGAAMWYSPRRNQGIVQASSQLTDADIAIMVPDSIAITDLPAYSLLIQLRPPPPKPARVASAPDAAVTRPPTAAEALAMVQSDLRALTIAQEGFLHATGNYSTSLARLQLVTSPGVHLDLASASTDGWSAVAVHPAALGASCVVYAGEVSERPQTLRQRRRGGPGEVVCDTQ